jgi:hypothetical protein
VTPFRLLGQIRLPQTQFLSLSKKTKKRRRKSSLQGAANDTHKEKEKKGAPYFFAPWTRRLVRRGSNCAIPPVLKCQEVEKQKRAAHLLLLLL